MNHMFETKGDEGAMWIPESDGYYIHADYVFSLSLGNFGSIQTHLWITIAHLAHPLQRWSIPCQLGSNGRRDSCRYHELSIEHPSVL